MVQIPYEEIGKGVALLLGVWSFLVSEEARERAVLAGAMVILFLIRVVFSGPAASLIALLGWMVFGLGCIIFLRLKGVWIR